jgi:hypothetical protein
MDITLRFGEKSNVLYAGILRGDVRLRLNILRTENFTSPTQMRELVSRDDVDQPYIQTATPTNGPNAGKDFVSSTLVTTTSTSTMVGRRPSTFQAMRLSAAVPSAPCVLTPAQRHWVLMLLRFGLRLTPTGRSTARSSTSSAPTARSSAAM